MKKVNEIVLSAREIGKAYTEALRFLSLSRRIISDQTVGHRTDRLPSRHPNTIRPRSTNRASIVRLCAQFFKTSRSSSEHSGTGAVLGKGTSFAQSPPSGRLYPVRIPPRCRLEPTKFRVFQQLTKAGNVAHFLVFAE